MLPIDCQSKEDGVCRLPKGTCQQCRSSSFKPVESMEKQTVFKRLTHEETTSPDGSVITGLKYDKDGNVEMIYWLRPVEGYFMTVSEYEEIEKLKDDLRYSESAIKTLIGGIDLYKQEVERLKTLNNR